MKVLKDNVLVELDPQEEITSGGIVLPEKAQDTAFSGMVVACGCDASQIKVGDHVFMGKYAGISMTFNEKPCLLLKEADILAVLE
jgi:chaperonin GroES